MERSRPTVGQRLLSVVIAGVVRVWIRLLRIRRFGPDVQAPGLVAFWHGEQLPLLAVRPKGPLVAPISLSKDGRLQAQVMARFGIGDVPGSSSRGGLSVARALLKHLRASATVLMAVDGPRGPRGQVQPGITWLAGATGQPTWPVGVAVSAGYRLTQAWDHFLLPRPGARVVIVFGAPLYFDPREARADASLRLAAAIDAATAVARQRLQDAR